MVASCLMLLRKDARALSASHEVGIHADTCRRGGGGGEEERKVSAWSGESKRESVTLTMPNKTNGPFFQI